MKHRQVNQMSNANWADVSLGLYNRVTLHDSLLMNSAFKLKIMGGHTSQFRKKEDCDASYDGHDHMQQSWREE